MFTFDGWDGGRLYFRRARRQSTTTDKPAGTGAAAEPGARTTTWEWSTGRRLWLPTSAADSIWCDSGDGGGGTGAGGPSLCGRLLVRRLELESQLVWGARCWAARAAAAAQARALPPLELPERPLPPRGAASATAAARRGGGGSGFGQGFRSGSPNRSASMSCPQLPNSASSPSMNNRNNNNSSNSLASDGAGGFVPGWGSAGGGGGGGASAPLASLHGAEMMDDVPDSFLCPLSQRVMTDPVVTPGEWHLLCSHQDTGWPPSPSPANVTWLTPSNIACTCKFIHHVQGA